MEERKPLNFLYGDDIQDNEEINDSFESENLFNRLCIIQKLIKRESALKELCKKNY